MGKRGWIVAAAVLPVLVCAGALVAAAASGALTQPVTRWISGYLGRELHADGGLRIELGRTTRVTADGLRLANLPWGARPDMLAARRVVVAVATRSLFEDTVILEAVEVDGLDLLLERTAAGENNWTLDLPPAEERPAGALPVLVERVSLPGARVRFTGPRLAQPLDLVLARAEQQQADGGMLEFSAQGQANDTPLDLRLSVGPYAQLLAARDVRFELAGDLGDIALDATGRVDSFARPVDTSVTLRLSGPDADYAAARFGIRNLGSGPFRLEAVLSPAPAGTGLRGYAGGRIGEFEVLARAYLDASREPARLGAQARVAGPDLSLAGGLLGLNGLPTEPFRLALDLRRDGEALELRDVALDLDRGRLELGGTLTRRDESVAGKLRFDASGPDLARLRDFAAPATLAPGPFRFTGTYERAADGAVAVGVAGSTALGQFTADGPLGAAPDYDGTRLKFTLAGADFARVGKALKLPWAPQGAFQGDGIAQWGRAGLTLTGAKLAAGGEQLAVDGVLGRKAFAPGTDIRFGLRGKDAARVGAALGLKGLPAGAYEASGRLRRQPKRTVLNQATLTVAGATLQVDGVIGDGPGNAGTDLGFTLKGPALENLAGLVPAVALPTGPFSAAGRATVAGQSLALGGMKVAVAGAQGTATVALPWPPRAGDIRFDVAARGPSLVRLAPGLGAPPDAGRNFDLAAAGAWLGDRWSFERLRLQTDQGFLGLQGDVGTEGYAVKGLAIEARTASLANLGLVFDQRLPDVPFEIRGKLDRAGTDLSMQDLSARLGDTRFTGRFALRGGASPAVDLDLQSDLVDLDPWVTLPGPAPAPPPPARGRRGNKDLLVPDVALALPGLGAYRAQVSVAAGSLRIAGQKFSDLRLEASLRDGQVRVDPVRFGGLDGQVSARLTAERTATGVALSLSGTGSNLALAPVPLGAAGDTPSRYEARFDLRGAGSSLRELAASLDGRVRLVGRGGRIPNTRLLGTSSDFVKQLVTALNPMATRSPTTDVVCTVYMLSARKGLVTTDPALVMRTGEIDIIANGSVDLSTEKIDFNFKTQARGGFGINVAQFINPYVKVTGTLASPGLALDPKGTLVNGGAAFATAGLSIVATTIWDRVFREKDPCGATVAAADQRAASAQGK